jgi:hypothetical protein
MFSIRFFPSRFFAARYWPAAGLTPAVSSGAGATAHAWNF